MASESCSRASAEGAANHVEDFLVWSGTTTVEYQSIPIPCRHQNSPFQKHSTLALHHKYRDVKPKHDALAIRRPSHAVMCATCPLSNPIKLQLPSSTITLYPRPNRINHGSQPDNEPSRRHCNSHREELSATKRFSYQEVRTRLDHGRYIQSSETSPKLQLLRFCREHTAIHQIIY